MCPDYNAPKEFFHPASRQTYCAQALVDKQIERAECIPARQYCQSIMQRYVTLLDNATYMPCEHIQKEKEYGIPWRTAFKRELFAFADSTYKRLVGEEGFPETEDPFLFFHKIVKKDALDAATFDAMSQADFISMMTENLELLEKCLFQIKALLKEPDFLIFEEVKA